MALPQPQEGLYAKSVGGDAFSEATKALTVETIKKDLGQVDLVVYSVATPRRTTPEGETYTSVLKPIGESFTNRTLLADKYALPLDCKRCPAGRGPCPFGHRQWHKMKLPSSLIVRPVRAL